MHIAVSIRPFWSHRADSRELLTLNRILKSQIWFGFTSVGIGLLRKISRFHLVACSSLFLSTGPRRCTWSRLLLCWIHLILPSLRGQRKQINSSLPGELFFEIGWLARILSLHYCQEFQNLLQSTHEFEYVSSLFQTLLYRLDPMRISKIWLVHRTGPTACNCLDQKGRRQPLLC